MRAELLAIQHSLDNPMRQMRQLMFLPAMFSVVGLAVLQVFGRAPAWLQAWTLPGGNATVLYRNVSDTFLAFQQHILRAAHWSDYARLW